MGNRGPGWDNYIALSYAAEQLFMAAQLLTSDTVPLEYAVQQTCERYLRGLVQHRDLLPGYVNTWIRECIRDCDKLRARGEMTDRDVQELAAAITNIFEDVRGVLARLSDSSESGQPNAA